jgi:GR25 family glycosyltransferase involved in LPS biosynthesis
MAIFFWSCLCLAVSLMGQVSLADNHDVPKQEKTAAVSTTTHATTTSTVSRCSDVNLGVESMCAPFVISLGDHFTFAAKWDLSPQSQNENNSTIAKLCKELRQLKDQKLSNVVTNNCFGLVPEIVSIANTVYKAAVMTYRLGDFIKNEPGTDHCCTHFEKSLACNYRKAAATKNITSHPNIPLLVDVLESYRYMNSVRQGPEADFAVLHLRLGDGLCVENDMDSGCRERRRKQQFSGFKELSCWQNNGDCWFNVADNKQMTFSKGWYTNIPAQLTQGQRVVIISDKTHWTRTVDVRDENYTLDDKYLNQVIEFFVSHGFQVSTRSTSTTSTSTTRATNKQIRADNDFAYACSANTFIASGSGFSDLIMSVVKARGGKIIIPSQMLTVTQQQKRLQCDTIPTGLMLCGVTVTENSITLGLFDGTSAGGNQKYQHYVTVKSVQEPANVVVDFLRGKCGAAATSSSSNTTQVQRKLYCNQTTVEHLYHWFCTRRKCDLGMPEKVTLSWSSSVINFGLDLSPWEHPLQKVEEYAAQCADDMGVHIGSSKLMELVNIFCSLLFCPTSWSLSEGLVVPIPKILAYSLEWPTFDLETLITTTAAANTIPFTPPSIVESDFEPIFEWVEGSVYINLNRRSDRRLAFEEQMKGMHMSIPLRLEATDDRENPQRGCTMSHLRALRLALENKYETVMIFEDDFKWQVDQKHLQFASHRMHQMAKNGFDVIMLAGNSNFITDANVDLYIDGNRLCEDKRLANKFIRVTTHNAMQTTGYIVHQRFYTELIEALEWSLLRLASVGPALRNLFTIDQIWKQFQDEKHEWWWTCPRIGSDRREVGSKVDSDINRQRLPFDRTNLSYCDATAYRPNHMLHVSPSIETCHFMQRLERFQVSYVILRGLPLQPTDAHPDIDILVRNYNLACSVLTGSVCSTRRLEHQAVKVGRFNIYFDLRVVGDHYYPDEWAEKMLLHRVRGLDGLYHLKKEDQGYALMYHVVVHKGFIGNGYLAEVRMLVPQCNLTEKIETWVSCLCTWMTSSRFVFSETCHNCGGQFLADVGLLNTCGNCERSSAQRCLLNEQKEYEAALSAMSSPLPAVSLPTKENDSTEHLHDGCKRRSNLQCNCSVAMKPSTCECTHSNVSDARAFLLRECPVHVSRTNTPELSVLVVWAHGLQHLENILSMVRDTAGVHVLRIVHQQLVSLEAFINLIYEKELATIPEHILSKTAYLQTLEPWVAILTIGDVLPVLANYGANDYLVRTNKNMVDLKWRLRAAFNPRNHEGAMSHEHIIHITDSQHDTLHLLKAMGGQPLSFEEYTRSHMHFYTPYWLPLPRIYKRQLVALTDLRIRCAANAGHCVAGEIISIIKSPHFGFVQDTSGNDGNKGRDAYALYYARGAATGALVDDHSVQAFQKLAKEFSVQRYGGCFPHPLLPSLTLRGLLLVKKVKSQSTYVLIDGAHRAALLAMAGVSTVEVVVIPVLGAEDGVEVIAGADFTNIVSECKTGQQGNSVHDTVSLGLRVLTYCGLDHTVLETGDRKTAVNIMFPLGVATLENAWTCLVGVFGKFETRTKTVDENHWQVHVLCNHKREQESNECVTFHLRLGRLQ